MRYPKFRGQHLFLVRRHRSWMQDGGRFPTQEVRMFWTVRGANAIRPPFAADLNGDLKITGRNAERLKLHL